MRWLTTSLLLPTAAALRAPKEKVGVRGNQDAQGGARQASGAQEGKESIRNPLSDLLPQANGQVYDYSNVPRQADRERERERYKWDKGRFRQAGDRGDSYNDLQTDDEYDSEDGYFDERSQHGGGDRYFGDTDIEGGFTDYEGDFTDYEEGTARGHGGDDFEDDWFMDDGVVIDKEDAVPKPGESLPDPGQNTWRVWSLMTSIGSVFSVFYTTENPPEADANNAVTVYDGASSSNLVLKVKNGDQTTYWWLPVSFNSVWQIVNVVGPMITNYGMNCGGKMPKTFTCGPTAAAAAGAKGAPALQKASSAPGDRIPASPGTVSEEEDSDSGEKVEEKIQI